MTVHCIDQASVDSAGAELLLETAISRTYIESVCNIFYVSKIALNTIGKLLR